MIPLLFGLMPVFAAEKICDIELSLFLLPAVGSAPETPGFGNGKVENLTGVMSVKGNNSRTSKGVAQRWDVTGLMWDRDRYQCQG